MTAFKNPATWVAFIIGLCAALGHGAFGPLSPAVTHLVNGVGEVSGLFGSLFLAATFTSARPPAVAPPPVAVAAPVPAPVAAPPEVKP